MPRREGRGRGRGPPALGVLHGRGGSDDAEVCHSPPGHQVGQRADEECGGGLCGGGPGTGPGVGSHCRPEADGQQRTGCVCVCVCVCVCACVYVCVCVHVY